MYPLDFFVEWFKDVRTRWLREKKEEETTSGANGYLCVCGVWVNYGETHVCNYNVPGTGASGYTCPGCLTWIPSGTMHHCYTVPPLNDQKLQRIIYLLEMLLMDMGIPIDD